MPRRNLDPNPSAAVDLTGISAAAGAAALTPTRVTGLASPWLRTTGARATTPATPGSYTELRRAFHTPGTALDGRVCSAVTQWSTSAALSCNVFLVAFDTGGANLLGFAQTDVTSTAGVVNTTVVTYPSLPTNTRQVAVWVRANSAATNQQLTGGLTRLELILDPNLTLADGASDRWAWDGTAGASTSTRAADDGDEWWALLAG